MITYPRSRTTWTVFISIFLATVYSDTFIGFRSAQRFGSMAGSCTIYQETKERKPTQIEAKENDKQKENTPEEQEIHECDYTNT